MKYRKEERGEKNAKIVRKRKTWTKRKSSLSS